MESRENGGYSVPIPIIERFRVPKRLRVASCVSAIDYMVKALLRQEYKGQLVKLGELSRLEVKCARRSMNAVQAINCV